MIVSEALVVAGLAQAMARDTVVAIPAHAGWVDTLSTISQIVIALTLIVMGITTIAIFILLWKLYRMLNAKVEKLRIDLDPVVKNAVAASEKAKEMVAKVQGNVNEISQTVTTANERIGRVIATAEERAADLNALLDVAQQEAEELFVRTASTLRGVRAGAGALRASRGGEPLDHEISDEELEIRIQAGDAGLPPRMR